MLCLHLVPDAIGSLDACLDFIAQPSLVELLADGGRELVKDGGQVLAHTSQPFLDAAVFLRMLIAETEVLQFFLYLVKAEAVGKGSVDVERLAGYLVLLARKLAAEGAHVVQTVGNLDKNDAYVVAHGEQQLFE